MMRSIYILLCLLVFEVTTAQRQSLAFDQKRLSILDSFMNAYVDQGKAPNVSVYIAHKGKTIKHQSYGLSNLELGTKAVKDNIYRIASQTKLLTSICVMMLMEEGHFYLDEPIKKFIPAFANPKILVKSDENNRANYETKPAKRDITIRHLLSHTAGIPYEHALQELPEFKVPFFCSRQPDILANVVDKIAKRPLISEPGESYVYGLNTDILGRLVEVVSGKSLDAFMQERLIKPLGMKDTYFYLPDGKKTRLVELYSKTSETAKLTLNPVEDFRDFAFTGAKTYFSGGAGLVSTIEDYAKVCQLILNFGTYNGKRLVSRKTVEMMIRNNIGDNFVWDRNDKFSLGLQIAQEDTRYLDNASVGALTWGGMYCSEYTIDHKEDLVMLVFTNVHPYAHYSDLVRKFRILVYQALK
jgi:CubicO group peptidase (beta-lactamase class C family)